MAITAVQATITHASQHHLSAAGALPTSMKIMSTRRALKKATISTAVPTQASPTDASSPQESSVASVKKVQARKNGLVTVNSVQ